MTSISALSEFIKSYNELPYFLLYTSGLEQVRIISYLDQDKYRPLISVSLYWVSHLKVQYWLEISPKFNRN